MAGVGYWRVNGQVSAEQGAQELFYNFDLIMLNGGKPNKQSRSVWE